jgi:hypothetical protein
MSRIQFRIRGLPGLAEISDADRAAVRSAIVGELACNGFASPRVDVVANGDVTSAYEWVNDPLNEPAAQRGISEVPSLAGDELWRYFVSSRFIIATFQGLWDSGAFPRYMDSDGNPAVIYNVDGSVRPDPDAAIRLDGFWLEFREPDTIVTNVWGVGQAAWPDVDFTATVDDRFYPGPGDEGVKVIKTDSTLLNGSRYHAAEHSCRHCVAGRPHTCRNCERLV